MLYIIIALIIIILITIITKREGFRNGLQLNRGNFVASPHQRRELEKKFKLDPIYNIIGGYSGQQRTSGASSDWSTSWRGPMVWNGWKYSAKGLV